MSAPGSGRSKGPLVHRDYELLVGGGKVGECTAGWLTLDVKTRRPVRPALGGAGLGFRLDGALALTPEKIASRRDLAAIAGFSVRNSDLDVNGHVNNTRYAQWILELVAAQSLIQRGASRATR